MQKYREIKKATSDLLSIRVLRRSNTDKAHAAIRDVIVANPTISYVDLAIMLGCSPWLLHHVAAKFGVRRPRGAGSPARRKTPTHNKIKEE